MYLNCINRLTNEDKKKLISPESPLTVSQIAEKVGISLTDYQSDAAYSKIINETRYNIGNEKLLMAAVHIYTQAI